MKLIQKYFIRIKIEKTKEAVKASGKLSYKIVFSSFERNTRRQN
jgi:hypothetical protein